MKLAIAHFLAALLRTPPDGLGPTHHPHGRQHPITLISTHPSPHITSTSYLQRHNMPGMVHFAHRSARIRRRATPRRALHQMQVDDVRRVPEIPNMETHPTLQSPTRSNLQPTFHTVANSTKPFPRQSPPINPISTWTKSLDPFARDGVPHSETPMSPQKRETGIISIPTKQVNA